ncbi:MAG: heparan-alpha-glucosaminide N-acetyltransferase domain-containing protein, partial [Nanoarchaeota archaeon]
MARRIESIDIFRGIAVLQMIFWQIFDFFAKGDIYSDIPYYFPMFNMPINGIGLALFTFASGASVYISISSRLKKGIKIKDIILHS